MINDKTLGFLFRSARQLFWPSIKDLLQPNLLETIHRSQFANIHKKIVLIILFIHVGMRILVISSKLLHFLCIH